MSGKITITWLGHSCYRIQAGDYRLVIDPYQDGTVPGLSNLTETANAVLCSHDHFDHNGVGAVTLVPYSGASPFTVTRVDGLHDDAGGAKRGANVMHVLEAEGLRIVHLGDIGCPLTPEQTVKIEKADVVMVPVGGFYTIDGIQAKSLVDDLQPRVVIPMHYRSQDFGFDVISTLDTFTSLCNNVKRYDGNTLILEKSTPEQTAILQYQG